MNDVSRSPFPSAAFDVALQSWCASKPNNCRLVVSAGLKDALALLEMVPRSAPSLLPSSSPARDGICKAITETSEFLRHAFVPSCIAKGKLRQGGNPPALKHLKVTSPLAGGIPIAHIEGLSAYSSPKHLSTPTFKAGSLNPGRTGFSHLVTGSVLWWRLWEVGITCHDLGLHFVVLSSPRLPPGTRLPEGFP